MLSDMGQFQLDATQISLDKSSITIAKNPALHGRNKHIDIRFHFIRGLIFEWLII